MASIVETLRQWTYNPMRYGAVRREWRALSDSQRWPRADVETQQEQRFAELVAHVRRFVPYCSNMPEYSALAGDNLRERLATLPILTKENVRNHRPELASRDPRRGRAIVSRTGGSTGEPLEVATSRTAVVAALAAQRRGRDWAGVRPEDGGASLKAHGGVSRLGRWRAGWVHLRPFASALSREHLARTVIPALKARPPRYLAGYPTSLLGLADLLAEGELSIPVVLSTGEMLYPAQRMELERKFRGRVFDSYGSNEVPSIAYECERGRKHVTDEHVLLEVVDPAGQPVWEEPGDVLVTDLRNRTMPFIRYALGDRGVLTREPCPCGRPLLVLKELEGRTQDALCGPNGTRLSGVYFAGRFRDLRGIRAYRIAQTSPLDVVLRYVPAGAGGEAEAEAIATAIREHLGADMRIELRRCEELPVTRTGKTRLVTGWPVSPGGAP